MTAKSYVGLYVAKASFAEAFRTQCLNVQCLEILFCNLLLDFDLLFGLCFSFTETIVLFRNKVIVRLSAQ